MNRNITSQNGKPSVLNFGSYKYISLLLIRKLKKYLSSQENFNIINFLLYFIYQLLISELHHLLLLLMMR